MISLKRYYDQDQGLGELFRATVESYAAMIETLRKYIAELHPGLFAECEADLSKLAVALAGPLDADLLASSRLVLMQTVQRMRELALKEEEARAEELRNVAGLLFSLTETFASRVNQCSVELGRFATEIEEIASCQNIQELRGKLRDRVQIMKDYVERTAQQDQETISTMESGVRALHEKMRIQEVLSGFDTATQLATREQIARIGASPARRQNRACVILLAVNRFQLIVCRFGPLAGDLVLKEFARRLGGEARENERTARWDETHFAVLADSSIKQAMERSRTLQEAVSGRYLIRADGRFIRLDISATVVVAERDEGETMEALTARAVSLLAESNPPPIPAH
jgi:diguanylate cyclase (GGDEF)-like protein